METLADPGSAQAAEPPAPADEDALIAAYLGGDADLHAGALAGRPPEVISWWAVLFPAPWAMYHKLWAVGAVALAWPILAGLVTGYGALLSFLAGLALARSGRGLVVARARATIHRSRLEEPDPVRLRALVAAQGGVSVAGLGIGLLAMVAPILAGLLAPAVPPSPGPAHAAGLVERAGGLVFALAPGFAIGLVLLALGARRVPLPVLGTALGMGAVAPFCAMPGNIAEHLVNLAPAPGLQGALKAFLVAAIPEEAAKLALLWLVALRHDGARPARDAPLSGALIGLGFAPVENAFYIVGKPEAAWLALARAVTAVPHHVAIGFVMGWLAAGGRRPLLLAFVVPVLLHGLYNLPLFVHGRQPLDAILREPAWGFGFGALLCLTWLLVRHATRAPAPGDAAPDALNGRRAELVTGAARIVGALVWLAVGVAAIGAAGASLAWGGAYAVVAVAIIMPLAFADLAWRAAERGEKP